jgi:hypothetical protein
MQTLEVTGEAALAARTFTAVDNEVPVGPPDVPRLLEVSRRDGVTVVMYRVAAVADRLAFPPRTMR